MASAGIIEFFHSPYLFFRLSHHPAGQPGLAHLVKDEKHAGMGEQGFLRETVEAIILDAWSQERLPSPATLYWPKHVPKASPDPRGGEL